MQRSLLRHARTNLVAYLALFVALSGSAYAAATIGSAQVKNNSLKSADIKNRSLLAKDFKRGQLPAGARGAAGAPGATGAAGPAGPAGPAGANGTNGTNGTNGEPGLVRAYGMVSSAGGLVAARSSGIASARRHSEGVFCITPDASIDPTTTAPIAAPNFSADATSPANDEFHHVEALSGLADCNSGEIEVRTFRVTDGADAGAGTSDLDDVLLDDAGFFIHIP